MWLMRLTGYAAQPGLGRRVRLALRLDRHRNFGSHSGEDLHRDLVRAEHLERLLEVDLVTIDVDASPFQRVGDVFGSDRAIQLAALPHLDAQGERRGRDALRVDLGFFALALALLLATGDVVLPGSIRSAGGGHGEFPWQQEVAGVALGNLLEFAAPAELVDVLRENDLHPPPLPEAATSGPTRRAVAARTRSWTPDSATRAATRSMNPGTRAITARTGRGTTRRTRARSASSSDLGMPSSSSFSANRASGRPSRNTSIARTITATSSMAPRIGMRSGTMSTGLTMYAPASPSNAFLAIGTRGSDASAQSRRAYIGARPASGRNGMKLRARSTLLPRDFVRAIGAGSIRKPSIP